MLREWGRNGNGVEVAAKYQVHPETLYRWKRSLEVWAIVEAKQREPWLSHRQISGRLREQRVVWVSESSCYRVLKAEGWVEERPMRERPWEEEARYEPYRPNQIWGLDWTGLRIGGLRWYLLTVIDFFSRYLLAWAIVKTVTQRDVTALVTLAGLDQKLDEKAEGGGGHGCGWIGILRI